MQQEFSQEVIGSTVILKTIKRNPQFLQDISEKQDLNFSQISFYQSSVDQFQNSDDKQISMNELNQYWELEAQLNEMDLNQIKKYFKEFVMRIQDQEQIIKRQELQLQTYQQSIWCHNSSNEKYEKIKISQQEIESSQAQIKDLSNSLQQCQKEIVLLNKQLQEKDFVIIEKQNSLNKLNDKYKTIIQTNELLQQKMETQGQIHDQQLQIYNSQLKEKDQQIERIQQQYQEKQQVAIELTTINEKLINKQKDLEQKLKQCNQFIQQSLKIQCSLVQQQQNYENNQKQKITQSNKIQIICFILQYIRRHQRSKRNHKLILEAKKNVEESNLIIEQLKFVIQKQKEQIKLKVKENSSKDEQLEQQKLQTKQLQHKIISQADQFAIQTEQIDKLNYEIEQYQNCQKKFEDSTKGDISLIFKNHLNYFYLSILQIKSIDKYLTGQLIFDMNEHAKEFNLKLNQSKTPFKFQIYVMGK